MPKNYKDFFIFLAIFSIICTIPLACCTETSTNSSNTFSNSSNITDVPKYYINISDKNGLFESSQNISPEDKLTVRVIDPQGVDVRDCKLIFEEDGQKYEENVTEHMKLSIPLKEYYYETIYNDTAKKDRKILVYGLLNDGKRTENEITLNLISNYCQINFTNNSALTITKNNKYKNTLEKEFSTYIDSAEQLEQIIPYFKTTENIDTSTKNETFIGLIDQLSDSSSTIMSLLEKKEVKAEANQGERELIIAEIENRNRLIAADLQYIAQYIALKELEAKEKEYQNLSSEYEGKKAELKTETLPLSYVTLCLLLGVVGGFLNVQRWKKKMDYLSTYSRKADAFNPVKLALIVSIVLILLMLVVLAMDDSLVIFKHLI